MSEHTFFSIDSAMQKVVDVVPAGNSVSHLVQVWSGIKPLLIVIEALPIFPPAWKKALAVFTAALDAVGTDPAFKAGKDL